MTTGLILSIALWVVFILIILYQRIRDWRKKKTCTHAERTLTITNHADGYQELVCKACGQEFIDFETTPFPDTGKK